MIKAKFINYAGESVSMDIDEVKDFIDMDCMDPTGIENKRFYFKCMDDQENGESIAVYEIGEK